MGNGGCGGAHPPIFQEVRDLLKVWLPLTGTLENKGISNIIATNSGATVNTSGKIGSCYTFNGSSKITATGVSIPAGPISASAWVYFDTNITDLQYVISLNGGSGFADHEVGLAIQSSSYYFVVGGNSSCAIGTPVLNTWTHMAVTFDGTIIRGYINGTLVKSVSSTATLTKTTFTVGARNNGSTNYAYFLKGRANDVRIYDHCLSAAEVKEISQGLVLHYRLDSFQGGYGNPNLITNFDTSFLSYADGATTLFTNQMNSGTQEIVSNFAGASKCLHLHSNGGNNRQYRTFSATSGKTYTVSVDYYSSQAQDPAWRGELNGGNYSWAGASGGAYNTPGIWKRMSYTYSNLTSNATIYFFTYCANGTDCYIKNIKIEEGSSATTWGPPGSSTTIIQDSSGYGHNGTITGNLNLSSDTPRYSTDIQFPGTAYIKITSPSTEIRTISLWAKWNSIPSGQSIIYVDQKSKTGLGLASNGIIVNANQTGNTFNKSSLVANTWYHFVIVSPNGSSNATRKFYINGVEQTATSNTNSWSYTIDELQLGKRSTSSDGFNGKISDFRMYCTALSTDDILSLYHTAAKVDNLGGLHTFEFQENGLNKITKTGITQGQQINEINNLSQLKYDPNVYIEPDGSAWVRIFHHNNPTSNKFASSDTFTTGVYKDENRWFNFDLCNNVSTWEFMLIQKAESTTTTETKYRWIQTKNPLIAVYADVASANIIKITTSGYTTFSHGGLYKINSNTYLCTNNGTNGNWWGAIGAWTAHAGGIPAWAGVTVKTGYVDVYLRIDNITTTMPTIAKTTKNNIWVGHNLIER